MRLLARQRARGDGPFLSLSYIFVLSKTIFWPRYQQNKRQKHAEEQKHIDVLDVFMTSGTNM
jgi:hypothetical protein